MSKFANNFVINYFLKYLIFIPKILECNTSSPKVDGNLTHYNVLLIDKVYSTDLLCTCVKVFEYFSSIT